MANDPPAVPSQTRFRIDAELARGGMATVFAAYDTTTRQRVALKRLEPLAVARMGGLFEREFAVLSSLKHPCIVDVYEYGVDATGPFYTMELLEGADLRELAPLPVVAACRYLRDVASSLALLHARRLLHRDVSPRNVRTLRTGGCKLIDFGALANFGATDEIVGTPPAIPPEALSGQALDQRADLFALGALAYFVLTGQHAYPARSVRALPDSWAAPLAPPSLHAPDIPAALDALVLGLLNLDALARPSNAGEVIERLNVIAGLAPDHDERVARAYFVGTTLVERARESRRTQRCLRLLRAGRGRALFIEGERGIGKTRLLADVTLKGQLAGCLALRAAAGDQPGPLMTARALVRQALRLAPGSALPIFEPHSRALEDAWGPTFLQTGPHADEPRPRSQPPPHVDTTGLPALLEECLLALAQRQPLIIAVDDVDRADAQSAALLMALARRARRAALLVVVSASADACTSASALRHMRDASSVLCVRELSEQGTFGLVQAAFGDVPYVRRTAQRLYAATRGNPQQCIDCLQSWLRDGLVRYVGGTFSLPIDLPEPSSLGAERAALARLSERSSAALTLARVLALLELPSLLDECRELVAPELTASELAQALEELIQADVVVHGPSGLRFQHEWLRIAAQNGMDPSTRRRLHLRIGERLLAQGHSETEPQIAAGLHILHGGQEQRGAGLIAAAARHAVGSDVDRSKYVRSAHALELALDVYRKYGRSRLEQLDLLVPLVFLSYEISSAFARRYAQVTLDAIEQVLGVQELRTSGDPPDANRLVAQLRAAPVLEAGETKRADTPDALTLISWLARCVVTLVGVASTAIDHAAQVQYSERLRLFSVFGPTQPAAYLYDYCRVVMGMAEDQCARCQREWTELSARLDQVGFAPNIARRLRVGAQQSLGILACYRDDDSALVRVQEHEHDQTPQMQALANQVRFLYYSFRGDLEQAELCRERVEAYAAQYGSAWQVEIWSTSTAGTSCVMTRDLAGSKRAVEQLERLKRDSPSLEPFWERAKAAQYVLLGDYENARDLYEHTLSRAESPRLVGYRSAQGGLARAYNALGQHVQAKQLCEAAVAAGAEDIDYVALNLSVHIELCQALAGLSEFAAALTHLERLFTRFTPNRNPLTMGTLHRTAAEIARRRGDVVSFEHHLEAMRSWFQPTRHPALIAQCEQLRKLEAHAYFSVPSPHESTTLFTSIESPAFASASEYQGDARTRRTLELLAQRAGAASAQLFKFLATGEPVLVSSIADAALHADVLARVRALFECVPHDEEETAFVPVAQARPAADGQRVVPLSVLHEGRRIMVGAVALPGTARQTLHHVLLRELALQLAR